MKRVTVLLLLSLLAVLAVTQTADAGRWRPHKPHLTSHSAANALQPANVYFGKVVSGQHPTATVTLRNPTGRNQYIRRFDLAGAGGGKFTLTWKVATCKAGMNLKPGDTCTLVVRVKTTRPEFWQTTLSVYYGPRIHARPTRGQFNGSVYAHVVAA